MTPNILNIQRFSIHDGSGIRTTVFFKGCPLSCAWCHNPESQSFFRQLMFDQEKCNGCGACLNACASGAMSLDVTGKPTINWNLCRDSGGRGGDVGEGETAEGCGFRCTEICIQNARCVAGEKITVKDLMAELLRDRAFYERSGGGVTLSGGEVMAQDMEFLLDLLKQLSREGISVNIDTCGEVPYERFQKVLNYVDTFLYDVKAMSPELHRTWTGRENGRILDNLKRLSSDGAKINLRIPVILEINGNDEEMRKMIAFTKEFLNISQVNLLPYHRVGSDKWERLGMNGNGDPFCPPSQERMEQLRQMWIAEGIAPVYIGG